MAGRPKSRPKPELPPFPPDFGNGRKGRKAFREWLYSKRIEHGSIALFDGHQHKLRYGPDDTLIVLLKLQRQFKAAGWTAKLSIEEEKFMRRFALPPPGKK